MKRETFKISPWIIWGSSLLLGALCIIPMIVRPHFNWYEAIVNGGITALFSLFVWYYNFITLPLYSSRDIVKGFSMTRLVKNLLLGLGVMTALAFLQQWLLSNIYFGPDVLMMEVRGVMVNLGFYMFVHLLYQSYHNQRVSIELEKAKVDNMGAHYELLKQQVNPHFLFNSLNTLKYMVESQDEHSVDFILKLSDFYRYALEKRKSDLIKVSEELDILRSYVYLLEARFEEGIDLTISVDSVYERTLIPPFTLQLLVENCIKHNVVSLDKPLRVRVFSEEGKIVVENRVQLKKTPEASTGVGLENIDQRYVHFIDKGIEILPGEALFTVKLPVIYENSHH
ncbi:MAG: histidine kinase [Bacteroidetes bacterium]|nr:histidine kinase [Bacteroidota bacterium]